MTGTIRMGCREIAALTVLPRFIAATSELWPGIRWDVDVDLTMRLKHKLENGQLDVALIVGPVDSHVLESSPIGGLRLIWMVGTTLLAKARKRASAIRPKDVPIWTLSRPSFQYLLTADVLRAEGLASKAINTCGHVKTLVELVRSGSGAALLPDRLIDANDAGLAAVFKSASQHPITFHVAMERENRDPVVRSIFELAGTYRL
jgi:DNA-binding transcriptional LysR family regulator